MLYTIIEVVYMQTTNLNVRINHEIKNQAKAVFSELGLTMTSTIHIFLRAAIAEGRSIAAAPKAKGDKNMSDLKAALS